MVDVRPRPINVFKTNKRMNDEACYTYIAILKLQMNKVNEVIALYVHMALYVIVRLLSSEKCSVQVPSTSLI